MPKGQNIRTVKPRTEKQRANTQAYRDRPDHVVAILPANAGVPTSSWWTQPRSREEFRTAVEQERSRMAESKFARVLGNSTFES